MDVVVSIHNNMNELTWKKILEWEKIRRCGVVQTLAGWLAGARLLGVG